MCFTATSLCRAFPLQWDAYPYLPPTNVFPPVVPDDGLYYVNSFEPYVLPIYYDMNGTTYTPTGLSLPWKPKQCVRSLVL
jgi:hypothetical protein